ncbi:MAG: shufflon system plasmid conjugative transfer pilus tip adhesin PilV [Rouxiella aceris]|uniref:shufflon system plasmid conjugative transfer pilus tip adhesin PilV n=1 Tax=Rouxiella aceris TaxID=2703884 RepID=UPI00284F30AC|nr:shufflon system plasmid conjugative transfer pilus tip adhesin PilV [Rouxiella aceris]MDR3430728.1 shufflon system plasmid conjugative transfer pilus tip adhesin PilV [Rouxiella aceris]
MSINSKSADRGWAVMSTGIGLLILLVVTVWAMGYYNDYIQQRGWQVTASQLSRFRTSVKTYVGRYYDTLLASAGTTAPVIVTPLMLKNTGLIESGFRDTTADGQQISAAVTRNATNTDQLQALVITQGGVNLPYAALRNISVDIDGMGGYVWKSTNVTGAQESWSVPLASFGVSTSSGHVAALIPADELGVSREESDRLYRFSVTGKPDLNRMHTDIDMGSNNLNNTNNVNAQTGNFSGNVNAANAVIGNNVNAGNGISAGGGITAGGDIRSNNGSLITRGNQGWLNETFGGGFYMSDTDWVRAINDKNIYTGGQVRGGSVRGGSVRSDSDLSGAGVLGLDQVNVAETYCPQNGTISHDGPGNILSCVNNLWKSPSTSGQYQFLGTYTSSFSGNNTTGHTMLIIASGGRSIVDRQIGDGQNCTSTWALSGQVNGTSVVYGSDNNPEWAKQGSITFPVPAGANYSVISSPSPTYGCSPGNFTLYSY